jgi:hypothetical protein
MNLKAYLAPLVFAVLTLVVTLLFILRMTPSSDHPTSEVSTLDAEVLQYFSATAEKYAKESVEPLNPQSPQKADQI